MKTNVHLSICVQAFNEEIALRSAVEDLLMYLVPVVSTLDIIIVDDASTDSTRALADKLAREHESVRTVYHPVNMGIGACFRDALAVARGNYYTDFPGDHENSARELAQAVEHLKEGHLVTTHHRNSDPRPLRRRLVSRAYTAALNRILGLRLKYYNGLTVFPTVALRRVPLTVDGFFYSAEALVKVLRSGYRVTELDYPLRARESGRSTALGVVSLCRSVRDCLRLLRELRRTSRTRTVPERMVPGWSPSKHNYVVGS